MEFKRINAISSGSRIYIGDNFDGSGLLLEVEDFDYNETTARLSLSEAKELSEHLIKTINEEELKCQ